MGEYVQSEHGQLYREGEETFLRSRDGSRFVAAKGAEAQQLLASGDLIPATADEVAKRQAQNRSGGVGGQLAAFGEGAVAGAVDLAYAPAAMATSAAEGLGLIDENPLAGTSGRQFMADVAGIGAQAFGGDLSQGEQYAQGMRERAQVNPLASGAGYVAPAVAAALATGGVAGGGTLLRTMGAEAILGGLQGGAAAQEDAFVQDYELTAEQMWAGAGLGALLGGGTAGAIGLVGNLARRGTSRLAKVFGRAGEEAPIATQDAIDASVSRALEARGVKPAEGIGAKVKEAIEASLGKDPAEALADIQTHARRAEIIDDAARRTAEGVEQVSAAGEDMMESVVNGGMRKAHMRRLISKENNAAQVAEARAQFDKIRQVIQETAPTPPPKGATAEEIAAHSAANNTYGNLKSRQQVAKYIGKLGEQMDSAKDGADVFNLLDEAKRSLQLEHKALGRAARGAGTSGDRGRQIATQKLSDLYEGIQENTRTMLEREDLWGGLGKWQADKNAAFKRYLDTRSKFEDYFMTRILRSDYEGRPVYAADPGKIRSYFERLGTADGELPQKIVQENLDAGRQLMDVIGDSSEQFAADIAKVREGYAKISQLAQEAEKTVKVSNQVAELLKAESESPFGSGALFGGVIGGIPGAIIGGAAGAATKPWTTLRRVSAVQEAAKRLDDRMGGAVSNFLRKNSGKEVKATGALRERVEKFAKEDLPDFASYVSEKSKTVREAGKRGAIPPIVRFALDGKDNKESFPERARQLERLADGSQVVQWSADNMGGMADQMPATYQAMVGKAGGAAAYLLGKVPRAALDPDLRSLGVVPSPRQLDELATAWEAVADPSSVFEQLDKGFVDPVAVEALKTVYPRLWQRMRDRALLEYQQMDEPPPIGARIKLDLLFDFGGQIEPSISPRRLQQNTQLNQLRMQQIEPQSPPSPGRSQPEVADKFATGTESIEL